MRRTGIIIGLPANTTPAVAEPARERLMANYPGVEVTIMAGATGMVAFEFDDGERAPDKITYGRRVTDGIPD